MLNEGCTGILKSEICGEWEAISRHFFYFKRMRAHVHLDLNHRDASRAADQRRPARLVDSSFLNDEICDGW